MGPGGIEPPLAFRPPIKSRVHNHSATIPKHRSRSYVYTGLRTSSFPLSFQVSNTKLPGQESNLRQLASEASFRTSTEPPAINSSTKQKTPLQADLSGVETFRCFFRLRFPEPENIWIRKAMYLHYLYSCGFRPLRAGRTA